MPNTPILQHESEFYLRAIFENAIDGIITINQRGIIESVNPAASKLFGYTADELVGNTINLLMPEPFKNQHDGYIQNYQKTGKAKIIGIGREVVGKRKDGSVFPFTLGVTELKLANRIIYAGFIHDISKLKNAEEELKSYSSLLEKKVEERTKELETAIKKLEDINIYLQNQIREKKQIEEELKESQRLYSTIARNFPYGTISVFDKELRYIFIDGKELFELGIDGKLLIGTKFVERLAPEIATTVEEQLAKVFDGQTINFELQFRDQFYILNAVPLADAQGEIKQILMVERNITQRKKADEELKKNLIKERELNTLKSRFVSMASHEFRTPLSTILSSISLVEKYKNSDEKEKYTKHINRIKSSVHNLTAILNDFLSLDKLEEGIVDCNLSLFNIENLIQDIIEEMQPVARKGQLILYKHSGNFSDIVLDPQILRNIMVNLISNAIKYSKEDKEIKVFSNMASNYVSIKVIDQGIGIPEEEQRYLFTRFFRGQNVSTIQGTGLGLNIVKKYVELLNGQIDYSSKENEGTTFILKFPINLN